MFITSRVLRSTLLIFFMVLVGTSTVILLCLSESYLLEGEADLSRALFSAGMTCMSAGAVVFMIICSFVSSQFINSAKVRLAEIAANEAVASSPEFTLLSLSLKKATVTLITGIIFSTVAIILPLLIGYHPGYPADQNLSMALALIYFIAYDVVTLLQTCYFAFVYVFGFVLYLF